MDLLPTILDCCGIEPPASLHGVSFRPLLENGGPGPREMIFAEKNYHEYYDPMRCVRSERYKYICNFHRGPELPVASDFLGHGAHREVMDRYKGGHPDEELYNLAHDPDEMQNLASKPAMATTLQAMRRRLARWMIETDDPLRHGPIESPTQRRTVQRLLNA